MDKKDLESRKLSDLREIAKSIGIENAENLKKSELIMAITGDSPSSINNNDEDSRPKRKRIKADAADVNSEQASLFSDEVKTEALSSSEPVEEKVDENRTQKGRQGRPG